MLHSTHKSRLKFKRFACTLAWQGGEKHPENNGSHEPHEKVFWCYRPSVQCQKHYWTCWWVLAGQLLATVLPWVRVRMLLSVEEHSGLCKVNASLGLKFAQLSGSTRVFSKSSKKKKTCTFSKPSTLSQWIHMHFADQSSLTQVDTYKF